MLCTTTIQFMKSVLNIINDCLKSNLVNNDSCLIFLIFLVWRFSFEFYFGTSKTFLFLSNDLNSSLQHFLITLAFCESSFEIELKFLFLIGATIFQYFKLIILIEYLDNMVLILLNVYNFIVNIYQ